MILEGLDLDYLRPDPNNPRKDFGDIEALAETFKLNSLNPGEPVNPIVVVPDGNVYRIVDGERRFRAMQLTRELTQGIVNAIVCEDMDEANAMVAMVATDDKAQLTDAEKSAGVQQMLILGVDEEKVDKAAKLAPGSASRVRRAREAAGERAEQMGIGQLITAGELLEEGFDEKQVEGVLQAGDGSWRWRASDLRREAEAAAKRAAFAEAFAACGVELQEERPGKGYRWMVDCREPEEAEDFVAGAPEGSVYRISGTHSIYVELYAPESEAEEAPEAEEQRRAEKELIDALAESKARVYAWYARALMPNPAVPTQRAAHTPRVDEWVQSHDSEPYETDAFMKTAGVEAAQILPCRELTGLIAAGVFESAYPDVWDSVARKCAQDPPTVDSEYSSEVVGDWLSFMFAAKHDGYEFESCDRTAHAALDAAYEAYLEANPDNGEDGEE